MGASSDSWHLSVDAILEGIGEGFFALDAQWRFVAFNRSAEELFGLPRADVIGQFIWDVAPSFVGSEFERRYQRVMNERVRQEFGAYTTVRPDRYHEVRAFPLGDGFGVAFRDATTRRQAINALQEREAELALVQKIGGVGGMEVDLRDGFRSRRSPEYLRLHGLSPASTHESYEEWVRRIHPDDQDWMVTNFWEAVASSEIAYQVEYRIVRSSDQQTRWMRAVGEFERDPRGRALRLVGAHLDITERKEAERQARESEERLRALADALPLLISYVDKKQYFRFVNKPYEIWFERPLSQIVGRKLEDVMGESMYEARRPFVERALAGESLSYEVDFRRSSGTIVTQVLHVPHLDESGAILGMYAVVQDITDRKLFERTLSESEERFRSIADSAPVPMWVSRLDGRRAFVNVAYQNFLALSYDECLNFDWRKALHPDDLQRILTEQKIGESSRQPFALEARYRRGDGTWRWLRSESQPRWGPSGEHIGFIGVAHDITIWKDAEQRLAQINETLEQRVEERTKELHAAEDRLRHALKMEAIGQLTGGIAHDFNNLLTGVIGALDLIKRRIAAQRFDDIGRFMEAASASATRAAALTHRLLAFARRQSLNPKATDVNNLILSIEELLRRTLGEQAKLTIKLFSEPCQATVDPNQLENAILNLVINARDAMPSDGVMVLSAENVASVEPGDSPDERAIVGDFVMVSVSDTGSGMTPEVRARVFDPFFTTKPIGQGTGLGLSMIYGFVNQSDGHIRIKSEVSRGTTVKLYFPRSSITEALHNLGQTGSASPVGSGETILLVEDEAAVRLLVYEMLADFGYQAIQVSDGPAAIEILQSSRPIDMLVTDVGLPGMNGRQLAEMGRRIRPNLKVLLMTGYAEKAALRSEFLKEEMRLVFKPFTAETLNKEIHDILNSR